MGCAVGQKRTSNDERVGRAPEAHGLVDKDLDGEVHKRCDKGQQRGACAPTASERLGGRTSQLNLHSGLPSASLDETW